MTPAVEVLSVEKTYPNGTRALQPVDLTVQEGEFVTLRTWLRMDAPFGALDEITRNRLDSDLLALWQQKKLTVIFVTHSIYEAVYLSTRVVVMAARPGRIVDEVAIDEPYPRDAGF